MQALPYVLPAAAAAATAAYLDGRHRLSHDAPVVASLIRAQLSGWNGERTSTISLFYTLEAHAKSSNRHRPWIIHHGESWSYAEAYEIVLKYGAWLTGKGVRSGEVVALDFVNSEVFIWCWFGCWSIGATPAFLNSNLREEPLVHCVRTSGAWLVLVDEHGRDAFSERVMEEHGFSARPADEGIPAGRQAKYGYEGDASQVPKSIRNRTRTASSESTTGPRKLEIVFFDKRLENYILSLKPTRQPDSSRPAQKRHDMAMLIYTSGTTGLPKPAIMSWHKANVGAQFICGWMNVKNTDVMYTAMPLYHSAASVLGVGTMLKAGGAIYVSQKFSHKTFWPEVRACKATVIQYVGETCRYLLAAPPDSLDTKHHVRAAFGNGLRPDVWESFKSRFGIPTIYEFYSATEAPAALFNRSTNTFSSGAFAWNGTLGSIIMGALGITNIRMSPTSPLEPLRDPSTGLCQEAGYDEAGELVFKLDAKHIERGFQGYFGNKKATSSKVLRDVRRKGDAYFRSGDLVRCDKEGRWYFVDRLGDTFRWKAENVSTAEVADILGKHDAVQEANVYGVEVPHHDGRAGCAAIVLKPASHGGGSDKLVLPQEKTLKSLTEHLKKELPLFAVPVWLRVTREMHTTGTNKQQKHFFQRDGIDVDSVEQQGDVLYWMHGKDGVYERFTRKDLERVKGGGMKL
ncbi:acetyl-CoA synthetase-like protein [Lentithecium fluviatile CBS 122367]|uniref:Acetyl-CoA synthetase-like protein n=1 Tax=Lentithecium fluviatile CBS 122367 TaxID=1168545 RepID=A0A6G1JNL4_9PLEO|nr:acetyl-CoA synthetase-like protein [Lentithecium fluviatile CBS 122367]